MSYRVVLAADKHPDYQFLLPLTAILWHERTAYRPYVLTPSERPLPQEVASFCDVEFFLPCNNRLYTKLMRWYAPVKPKTFHVDDQVMLQDVDIWPIDPRFWVREDQKPLTCFYGDAFQGNRHCTSGFMATPDIYRQILGTKATAHDRLRELQAMEWEMGSERLHSDDAAQSDLTVPWIKGNPQHVDLVQRGPSPPANRIDRSNWPEKFDLEGKVDAHLPRDASDRRVWLQIRPLFRMLAPGWADWADAYRDAWERASA